MKEKPQTKNIEKWWLDRDIQLPVLHQLPLVIWEHVGVIFLHNLKIVISASKCWCLTPVGSTTAVLVINPIISFIKFFNTYLWVLMWGHILHSVPMFCSFKSRNIPISSLGFNFFSMIADMRSNSELNSWNRMHLSGRWLTLYSPERFQYLHYRSALYVWVAVSIPEHCIFFSLMLGTSVPHLWYSLIFLFFILISKLYGDIFKTTRISILLIKIPPLFQHPGVIICLK